MNTNAAEFAKRAALEIDTLHQVLQSWFRAEGPDESSLVLEHFDKSFRMISPSGIIIPYSQFAAALPTMRGSRPSLIMEVREIEVRFSDASAALISYHEHQDQDGNITDRWSTALLANRPKRKIPQWIHLHETWKS